MGVVSDHAACPVSCRYPPQHASEISHQAHPKLPRPLRWFPWPRALSVSLFKHLAISPSFSVLNRDVINLCVRLHAHLENFSVADTERWCHDMSKFN